MTFAARYARPLTMHWWGDAEVCGAQRNALECKETHFSLRPTAMEKFPVQQPLPCKYAMFFANSSLTPLSE